MIVVLPRTLQLIDNKIIVYLITHNASAHYLKCTFQSRTQL